MMKLEKNILWERSKDSLKTDCILNVEEKRIVFKGDLGTCEQVFQGNDILFDKNKVLVKSKSSFGYFSSRIKSLLKGVNSGYFLELTLQGRGFRFIDLVDKLLVKVGYTHYVEYKIPKSVKIVGSRNNILIFGLDLEEVNRVGALIRKIMVPEIYKGKGIRYVGEEVMLKVGKKN